MISESQEVEEISETSSDIVGIVDIVIIEDDVDELTYLNEILTREGYRVRPTRSGSAGLRAAHYLRPNIILLDIQLPDIDGFEVCRQIKADPDLQDVPVIFVTGATDVDSQVKAFDVGGRDYITKPFKEIVVLTRIQNQLEIQQLQQETRAFTQLQERHRIARDLHDSVSQTLFALGSLADSLTLTENNLSSEMTKDIAYIHKLSQIALKEMRLQLFELRSKELLQTPIEKLAQELVELVQTRIGTEFSVQIDDVNEHFKHNPILKVAVYRIMREAIFNAIKHANATMVNITITDSEHHTMLVIEDDGIGIDKLTEFRTGSGISNMYERATQAGIDLNIDTQSGVGTKVQAIWENKDKYGGEHSHSTRR